MKRDSLIGVNDFKWVNDENKQFVKNNFNDESWIKTSTQGVSEAFEKNNFNGIGWIRQQINISQITKSDLVFDIGKTNDLYTVFVNGKMIGRKEYWGIASTKYLIKNDLLKRGNNTISIRFIDVYILTSVNINH